MSTKFSLHNKLHFKWISLAMFISFFGFTYSQNCNKLNADAGQDINICVGESVQIGGNPTGEWITYFFDGRIEKKVTYDDKGEELKHIKWDYDGLVESNTGYKL